MIRLCFDDKHVFIKDLTEYNDDSNSVLITTSKTKVGELTQYFQSMNATFDSLIGTSGSIIGITNAVTSIADDLVTAWNSAAQSLETSLQDTVTVVATNSSGCSYTAYKYIHVESSPIASFTSAYNSNNGVSTFTNTSTISTGTINQFDWSFGDNLTSQIENPNHVYASTGTYTVKLIVTSIIGCSDTTTNSIIITPSTNNLEELGSISNVSIYPNPTSDNIAIEVKEKSDLNLFDLAGNQISETIKVEQNSKHSLNLSNLSSGIYILKVQNEKNSKLYKIEVIK